MPAAVIAFIEAFLAQLPALSAAGVALIPLIEVAKNAIQGLLDGGNISNEDKVKLKLLMDNVEATWAIEVSKAQKEVDSLG